MSISECQARLICLRMNNKKRSGEKKEYTDFNVDYGVEHSDQEVDEFSYHWNQAQKDGAL